MKTILAITLFALVSLSAAVALAGWDPERIAEVKSAAETAYDAGDYREAARNYIELRNMLKSSLAAGEVPSDFVDSAQAALIAVSYQLGRSNQLSDNCSGAETIYRELLEEALPPALEPRVEHRLGETLVCRAYELADADGESDPEQARGFLEEAQEHHRALDAILATEQVPETARGELKSESVALGMVIDQGFVSVPEELAKGVEHTANTGACDQAERKLQDAEKQFPDADFDGARATYDARCQTQEVVEKPVEPPATRAPSPWPWVVTGVGGAVLVAAVSLDAVVASDISEYQDILDTCKAGVAARCDEARQMYDDIQPRQDAVLGLYVSGGVIVAGGLIWGIVDLVNSDAPSDEPKLGLLPGRDGVVSSVQWHF